MNTFVQLSSKTFFTDFYANFVEYNDSLDTTLIVCHNSKGFGIERKDESWIWRFFRWLTTTSYDLQSHAFTILQLAESLDPDSVTTAELASASKVCSLLRSVFERPYRKDANPVWEGYVSEYTDISRKLLVQAAAKEGISPLLLACREGRFPEALFLVEKNGVASDASGFINQLVEHCNQETVLLRLIQAGAASHPKIATQKVHWVAVAMQHKAYDVVDRLLTEGALAEMNSEQGRELLLQAIIAKQSKLAITIISYGVDVLGELDKVQGSFLHAACRYELIDVVSALLEKGVSPFHTNKQKQTALHIASEVLNGELVMLLLSKGADLSLRDANDTLPLNAPLKLFSDDSIALCEFYQIVFLDFPSVQQFLQVHGRKGLGDYLLGNVDDLLDEMEPKLFLELATVLQYEPLAKALVARISKEQFLDAIAELSARYTQHAMAMIKYAPYTKNPVHYGMGVQNVAVDKLESVAQLNKYLNLFDALNTENDARDDFFDLERLRSDNGHDISREVLRENFSIMLDRIIHRVRYDGHMPAADSSAFKTFYETIENALENVRLELAKMKREKDPRYIETMHFVFRELLGAMKHCPGRYFNTSIKLYLKVCKNLVLSFPDEVYTGLGEFRQILIEGWLSEVRSTIPGHNVNDDNYILRRYGKKYGLPGASIMETYLDPYGGASLENVDKMFEERYTPQTLIDQWLLPLITQSDQFPAWCKTLVPDRWKKEHYEPIYKGLQELQNLHAEHKAIVKFLEDNDIVHNPKVSYEESVREDWQHSYIGSQLYDESTGKLKHSALCDMLVRLQIVSSCFEEDEELVPKTGIGGIAAALKRFIGI